MVRALLTMRACLKGRFVGSDDAKRRGTVRSSASSLYNVFTWIDRSGWHAPPSGRYD